MTDVPTSFRAASLALLLAASTACGGRAQEPGRQLVESSDPVLGELAAALLPDLAERAGLELKEPVRLEMRSREELVQYLRFKLDQELPAEEAQATVEAYALLGLVSPDMDLRAVLLDLYTEQVAGFYEPDSTALFVMDDQPQATLQGLLVHELVHAVQDQWADLDAITDPAVGNDRATAAQAAIEGHATLVMLEYMTEQMSGTRVDLAEVPDFAAQIRPALEGMRTQFPALAAAPAVIQESLLFPYLEGAGFVQRLWVAGARVAPFGEQLPQSTERIMGGAAADMPVELELEVRGGRLVDADVLGRLEVGVMLDEHLGPGRSVLADGWGGDRYALVEPAGGGRVLIWHAVWDDEASRDAFAAGLEGALDAFGGPASLERVDIGGRPGTRLEIGPVGGVTVVPTVVNQP